MCKCSWGNFLLGVLILIFALIETANSKWVIVVASILIILGTLSCRECGVSCSDKVKPVKKSPVKRKVSKKKKK